MTLPNTFPLSALPRRFLLASATALALLGSHAHAADKLPVTASFSILGDLVRVVGGERVAVTTLVGANEDAHVFEAKPSDAKTLLASRLVVLNGLGFEPWAGKLLKSSGYKGESVIAAKGVKARHMEEEKGHTGHAHEETDPHAWQNPNNVVLYVRNIAAGLSKVDAAGAASYQANAEAYVKELQALDAWAKAQIATIPAHTRKVITSHDAFGYFAAHYGVKFLAPQGVNTETEPSAKQVAQLIKQIQREKIRAVFVENMGNPKLIAQLSKDAGATLGASLYADALSAPDQPGATYLQMVRHNVAQLVAGMRLN
ncbi:MAG: metal ABC transporter substrate-binding protein [Curvibacter sp. RIFCSPHIGHO2_12_FULL_63_18]|uniref:metal ABC transporter substrate-binding protein n=1 Tax=Rhodoferax sp. TaxID=50421 RepID=UPI0008CDA64D|nr:metal ABC transporter substrate-binding protein [Rhodoferax sp.]OGO98132.1 MAG: metal ABC transporter substrate-binding protein [Curvibacter sp. GWA2_63_95]OGP00145.1 MAG: metal ABC transporter substrate-binding protein [Curvibacter sp. RIFCSPHIGHO2_12_FULL_63_18]HCX82839.1 metal ABC transporter substrate-binding protein [Rhodoferax sp.]